jgi:hypothetical protein
MKTLAQILGFFVIVGGASLFCYKCGVASHACPEQKIVVLLPNQGQLQEILNAIEPNDPIEVDYFVGGKSRGKWDRVVNNKYASVFFTPSGAPKGE